MRVCVVGAAGRMGRWFSKYFSEKGWSLKVYDVRVEEARRLAEGLGAAFAESLAEALEGCELVLVSVPIGETPRVVRESLGFLKPGSRLAEISSLKSGVVDALREASLRGVVPLSLHPLFGPGADGLEGRRMALIPVADAGAEVAEAERVFPEARLVVVGCEEHDRAMALILSLTHAVNLALAHLAAKLGLERLTSLAGTTFELQLTLAKAVLSEEPSLLAALQSGNRFYAEVLKLFLEELRLTGGMAERGDAEGLAEHYRSVRSLFGEEGLKEAYHRLYKTAPG